jgi:hypothetical protein
MHPDSQPPRRTFDIPLPHRNGAAWLLAWATIWGIPISASVFFYLRQIGGAYPPEADSISIPIGETTIFALALAPLILLTTFLCVRRRRAGGSLLAWRSDRPILSVLVTIIFGGPALLVGALIIITVWEAVDRIDLVWIPHLLVCIVWLQVMRAMALQPRRRRGEPEPIAAPERLEPRFP